MRRASLLFQSVLVLAAALGAAPAGAGGNYALLVAVGDYDRDELRPLKYSRADVLEFHDALVESGFPSKNIVLMHDDFEKLGAHYRNLGPDYRPRDYLPEGAKIRRELALLLGRLREDDSVVVAFAGHGVQRRGEKKSYFCPADAKLERKETLVAFEEVFAALRDSAATRKLFLVDACQNDPLSEAARSRATVDLESVTRPQSEPVPEGIVALFSCKAGQKSYELPELGHGVFFHTVLEGWKGAADKNDDGRLTYKELADHAESRTSEIAALKLKVLQTPQLRTEFSGEWILRNLKAAPAPKLRPYRALVVGIDDFDDPSMPDLKFCQKDADGLVKALSEAGCADEDMVVLTDARGRRDPKSRPTKANILRELDRLAEGPRTERAVLVLTGSGVQFPGTEIPLYIPCDANPKDPATLVSLREIEAGMGRAAAGTKIVFMDTCRDAASLQAKGVRAPANVRDQKRLGERDVAFFFSCSLGEQSYESDKIGHGVFTHAVLEGLGGKADADQDRTVTLRELSDWLKKTVPPLPRELFGSTAVQTPDIRLGLIRESTPFITRKP